MSSRQGGLLELVARGKKDIFFTSNPQICFFHSVYTRCAPFTKEIYVAKPRNSPEWGKYVDFDIDHRGDILHHLYLRIQLPSWLPNTLTSLNTTGVITDMSGVSYGFTNRVGHMMIDKIQYFNDNVLLFETYGTYMDWRFRQAYEFGITGIVADEIGHYNGNVGLGRSVGRVLRVPIPFLGSQRVGDPGLPISALRGSRYRIRVHLRPYNEMIVASDNRIKPNPFNMRLRIQEVQGGVYSYGTSLPPVSIKGIDMSLESTYFYLPSDVNTWLKAVVLRFPFHHIQQQIFTLEDNIMNAVSNVATPTVNFPLTLDYSGPVDRLLIGIRSEANTLSGKLTDLTSPGGVPFIRSARLNIANIDRVKSWDIAVLRDVSPYWKNKATAMDEIYSLTFGGFDYNVPSGTISFTRAVLPTLYFVLGSTAYDPRTISRKAFAIVYAESWNVYEITRTKGALLFDDS